MKLKTRLIISVVLTIVGTTIVLFQYHAQELGADGPLLFDRERFEPGGHLGVMRKDLDLSNQTGENSIGRGGHLSNGELEYNDIISVLSNKVLHEKAFKKKETLDLLVLAADLIKNGSLHEEIVGGHEVLVPGNHHATLSGERADESKPKEDSHIDENSKKWIDNGIWPRWLEHHSDKNGPPRKVDLSLAELDALKGNKRLMPRRSRGPTMNLYKRRAGERLKNWEVFHNHISQFELYSEDDPTIDALLDDLAKQDVVDLVMKSGGTQLKLTFYFEDDSRAMWKPMRFPRDQGTMPDHFYFSDFERHYGEIASFYLDRALGFRRVPPTVGRLLNVTSQIKVHATGDLLRTFFVSPAGNNCFHGKCDYYCDTTHAVCGRPDLIEGSMMAYLPSGNLVDRKTWRHPWRRSYNKRKKADWETDPNYCHKVRAEPPYSSGRRLLDLMDMAIFDFLTGNLDRHHYETWEMYGNFTYPLHLDQGRAFGKSYYDDLSCLAPVYQCCLMRASTLQRLLTFHQGPPLSQLMRDMMKSRSPNPVLTEPHLEALDRRVDIALKTVYKCIQKNGWAKVVIDDGF